MRLSPTHGVALTRTLKHAYWLIMFTACHASGPVISSRMITGMAYYLRCRMFPTTVQMV
jgi:hypothetical protein